MAAESAGRWASTRIQGDVDAVGGKKGPRGAQTEPEMPERYNGKSTGLQSPCWGPRGPDWGEDCGSISLDAESKGEGGGGRCLKSPREGVGQRGAEPLNHHHV